MELAGLRPAIVNTAIGIITGALESLGAQGIEATYRDVTLADPKCGFDTVTFYADFEWRLEENAVIARP